MMLLHGRASYKKQDGEGWGSRKAAHVVATMILVPQMWDETPLIRLDHLGLKTALNLPEDRKYFKPSELMRNPRLGVLFGELTTKRTAKEKLNPFDQAAQRLESQLVLFQELQMGGLRVAPSADPNVTTWLTLESLSDAQKDAFFNALKAYTSTFTGDTGNDPQRQTASDQAVAEFVAAARANNPNHYPAAKDMAIETHYNSLAPFQWSWVFYALAAVLLFLGGLFNKRYIYIMSWVATGTAFILHTYGFALRVYITERPPVSNMYETVVWVAWGAIVFTAVFSLLKNAHTSSSRELSSPRCR